MFQPCPAGSSCAAGTASVGGASACAIGWFAPAGSSACSPCPRGFFGTASGAANCSICFAGSTTYLTAQTTCVACAPASAKCLAGAFAPIAASAIPQSSSSIRVVDPFAVELAANRAFVGDVQQTLLIAGSCVIIVGAVVGIWAQRRYNVHGELLWLTNLDFQFANGHFVPYSEKVADIWAAINEGGTNTQTRSRLQRTALGAVLSISCLCVQVMLCVMLYLNNTKAPTATSSVSSLPPAFAPHGTFALNVMLVGSNMTGCSSGAAGGIGIELSHTPGEWLGAISSTYAYNAADGSCGIVWKCASDCVWSASRSELRLVSSASSWASFVTFAFQTPALAVSATEADATNTQPFSVESAVIATDGDDVAVLRGGALAAGGGGFNTNSAAVVSLSLSPYSVTMPDQTVRVSYQPALSLVTPGTVYRRATFQHGSGDGFAVTFVLTRNSVTLMTTLVTPAMLTFLILMMSMIGLATKLFSFAMRWAEFLLGLNRTPPKQRSASLTNIDNALKLAMFEARLSQLEGRNGDGTGNGGDGDNDATDGSKASAARIMRLASLRLSAQTGDMVGDDAASNAASNAAHSLTAVANRRGTLATQSGGDSLSTIELVTRNPLGLEATSAALQASAPPLPKPPLPPPIVYAVGAASLPPTLPPSLPLSARMHLSNAPTLAMPAVIATTQQSPASPMPPQPQQQQLQSLPPRVTDPQQPGAPIARTPPPLGRAASTLPRGDGGNGGGGGGRDLMRAPPPPPPPLSRRMSLQSQAVSTTAANDTGTGTGSSKDDYRGRAW
jgi:hypothetical protein